MLVRDVMHKEVITPSDHAMLSDAAMLMWDHDIGFVPVLGTQGGLAGVLSLNDLARRATRESNRWLQEDVAGTLSAIVQPRPHP